MKRIFPFNPSDKPKWHNWSNYLIWLNNEAESLQQYINLFNANFFMINEELSYISSNTMKEGSTLINPEDKPWKQLSGETDEIYFCFPGELTWRQGIFSTHYLSYLCLDPSTIVKTENGYQLTDTIQNLTNTGKLIKVEPSTMIFARNWMKTIQSIENKNYYNMDRYQLIARPYAGAYLPTFKDEKLTFTFVRDAQGTLGDSIILSLEFLPNRYFCTDDKQLKWKENYPYWDIQAANWNSVSAPISKIIENSAGQVWVDNYPLMHECQVELNGMYEEFIFDHEVKTEPINVANHNTMVYTITAKETNDYKVPQTLLNLIRVEIL